MTLAVIESKILAEMTMNPDSADIRGPEVTIVWYPRERFSAAAESLASLLCHTPETHRLILVDTLIPMGIRAELERLVGDRPKVDWVRSDRFLNTHQVRNLALTRITTAFTCFIENACVVEDGWLNALLVASLELDAGIVTPRLMERMPWRFGRHHDPGLGDIIRIDGADGHVSRRLVSMKSKDDSRYVVSEPRLVPTAEAHCLLFTRAALSALSPFDETMTVGTHVDLCCDAAEKNIRIAFAPSSNVTHLPTVWLAASDRGLFDFRWDVARAVSSRDRIVTKWKIVEGMPDVADFARQQRFRVNPFLWWLTRPKAVLRRLVSRVRASSGDEFLRHNAIFLPATLITGLLNYLLHPILARVLTLDEYGDVQALMSLNGLLSVGVGLFGAISLNILTNADDHDHADLASRTALVGSIGAIMRVSVTVWVGCLIAASPWIASFFGLGSIFPVLALTSTFAMITTLTLRRAYLGSKRDFMAAGVSQVIMAASRLAFAAVLGYAGFGATGALVSVTLAQIVTYAYVRRRTRDGFRVNLKAPLVWNASIRRELRYGALVLVTGVATGLISTGDILVIKHYFDPETAGLYGGIAIIARVALYAAGSASVVLTPYITMRRTRKENARRLASSLAVIAVISGGVLALFHLFPEQLIRLLIGSRYLEAADWLPRIGLLAFAWALVSPLFAYYLALRKRFAGIAAAFTAMVALAWSAADHSSPERVIAHFTWAVVACGLAFLAHAVIVDNKEVEYA